MGNTRLFLLFRKVDEDEIIFGGFRVTKVEDQKAKKMQSTGHHADGSLTITSGDKKALVPRPVARFINWQLYNSVSHGQ